MKISANGYITIVILAGFALIALLFTVAREDAPSQLPLIFAATGGLIVLIRQQADVVKKVEENTEVTETTHKIVNSRMDEFKQALIDVAALKEQQAAVLAEVVLAKSELKIANERAAGISIGREQVASTIDAVRATDVASAAGVPTVTAPVVVVAPKKL